MIAELFPRYMQLALIAGVVVGIAAPLLGAFLVERRLSLLGDGLGHLAFAGVAIGLATGMWPLWSAFIVATLGAIGIEALRSSRRASADMALALFFYGGIALGVIVISSAGSFNAGILSYLFGSILTVSTSDVVASVALCAVIVIIVTILRRSLFAVVLDDEVARVSGLPVRFLNYLLAVLAAVTVVAAMRVVGLLLVAALLVVPIAASQQVARSFTQTRRLGALIGAIGVICGLLLSRSAGLAPGGTIVLVLIAIFCVLAVLGRMRSVPHTAPRGAHAD